MKMFTVWLQLPTVSRLKVLDLMSYRYGSLIEGLYTIYLLEALEKL